MYYILKKWHLLLVIIYDQELLLNLQITYIFEHFLFEILNLLVHVTTIVLIDHRWQSV
jgi:hypothetical protein